MPKANSPNYICSSSYATCVGGTEFADTCQPLHFTGPPPTALGYLSALSYIPEGAWNESSATAVAATGGGVSTVIATPSWQTGTGVPSARTGRYTPDISFSASAHDGYFACMAAVSAAVASQQMAASASSPSLEPRQLRPAWPALAALLDQKIGVALGNLNPQLYSLAASTPSVFHDATPASSGVSSCTVNTPSMCNNSIPGASGTAAQAGFQLTAGFDEATGLGSPDGVYFLSDFPVPITTPTVQLTLTPSTGITSADLLQVDVTVTGVGTITPSGNGNLSGVATPLLPCH